MLKWIISDTQCYLEPFHFDLCSIKLFEIEVFEIEVFDRLKACKEMTDVYLKC